MAWKDPYYVVTKLSDDLINDRLHPNTGAPLYNVVHNVSDLIADADLHLGEHLLSADEISSNTYNFSEDDTAVFTIADHTLTFNFDGVDALAIAPAGITAPSVNITDEVTGYQIDGADFLRAPGTNIFLGAETAVSDIGSYNVFVGFQAGENNLHVAGDTGHHNIYIGYQAGQGDTTDIENTGRFNVAMGSQALRYNTSGYYNFAMGSYALHANTTGHSNSAMGYWALRYNTSGYNNFAMGSYALGYNTTGSYNLAMGYFALHTNTTGNQNAALGYQTLRYNTTGDQNAALGYQALRGNKTGSYNLALGFRTGYKNVSGHRNIFLGFRAGYYQTLSDRLVIDNQNRGSAAVELTNVIIYGVMAAAPADQTLRFNAAARIGTGDNYVEIKNDGEINLHGAARVERHLDFAPERFKMPAANFPGESFEGIFYTLDFDRNTEQSTHCQDHIPFRWDNTTDIEVIVDWFHTGADAGAVVWGIEYKSIKAGEALNAVTTTITHTTPGTHPENQLIRTVFTSKIVHANLERDDDIGVRFYRKAGDAGDTLDEDARFVELHFHFIINQLGEAT